MRKEEKEEGWTRGLGSLSLSLSLSLSCSWLVCLCILDSLLWLAQGRVVWRYVWPDSFLWGRRRKKRRRRGGVGAEAGGRGC